MASFGHVGTVCVAHHSTIHFLNTLKLVISVLAVVELRSSVADISAKQPVYFDQLYAQGVKAYNDQLWYKCAYNLESAVKEYRTLKKTLTDCRLRCKGKDRESNLDELPSDSLGEFVVFGTFLKHADCFRRCKRNAYELRPGLRLTKTLEAAFELRRPYQYLQFCWYKLDRVKQAASASYTFYLANPEDEDVKRNIAFYRDKAKVPESDFLDLELKPYKEQYIRAMLAYSIEDWPGMVEHMEKGIEEFFVEEERCRVDCEDNMGNIETTHFSGIIADHFLRVLECQLGCEGNLSVVYTVPVENFLSEQFHYLQYAYYKLEKIQEAVEATASFLMFHPEDDIVKDNKNIFIKKYLYSEDQFIPRKAVREYVQRKQKLQSLLDFLQENLEQELPDGVYVTSADTKSEPLSRDAPEEATTEHRLWMDRYERLGLHVIAKESDLQRPYRFAADGLLKQEQCEDILVLMEDIEVDKKGVQTFTLEHGRKTVVTADENYEASLRLFMRATEVMRHYTQRYYNFSDSLYFKRTRMVCWRQVPEPEVENDCIPQEFGTCDPETNIKDRELVKDHFVTATYLNTLDDGDVYFLGENVTVDTSLGVKFGRTIGFQAGDRHGLHIPSSAPRCAIVITYSMHHKDDDQDYSNTIEMLQRLEEVRMEKGMQSRKDVMQNFENMGVRVVRNGSSLQGDERFVADGLSSEAECMSLKNMVMDLGKAGDGYGGRESPHTQNELFAGLNLKQLTQELEMSGALVGDGYDHLETKPSFISPHTEHELFQGLTIYRAAKLMHMGLVNTFSMRSFLDLSEKSRLFVEKYFNLTQPLFFDFTHLVCRSAVDDSKERDDLSHPVHADNCVLQPDGSCIKDYPAFVQRDYSAILYLNDDFEGGEFFFAYSNKTEQTSLRPKCGRLVGFNAAEFHGVKAVRKGTRCAMALWFTLNPNFKELAHIHAKKVLRTIQKERDDQESEKSTADDDVRNGAASAQEKSETEDVKSEEKNSKSEENERESDSNENGKSKGDSLEETDTIKQQSNPHDGTADIVKNKAKEVNPGNNESDADRDNSSESDADEKETSNDKEGDRNNFDNKSDSHDNGDDDDAVEDDERDEL